MMNRTKRARTGILAGVLAGMAIPVSLVATEAQAAPRRPGIRRPAVGNWVRLGSKRVDGRRDSDSINLDDHGRFRALMFRVTNSPARIRNVVVHFENGSTYKATVRDTFSRGERSSVIDLPGSRRNIDRVTFHYSDLRRGNNAEVTLFGQR